jgi:hypothetical protein
MLSGRVFRLSDWQYVRFRTEISVFFPSHPAIFETVVSRESFAPRVLAGL